MLDTYFDSQFLRAHHLKIYPNLLPWVGNGYRAATLKILLLGESHYLPKGVSYHHDVDDWYSGIQIASVEDLKWITTRSIIKNGLQNGWKGASKTIYRNLSSTLVAANFSPIEAPFASLAYMNFFQRPAEKTGESLRVKDADRRVGAATVTHVASCLKPNLVIFCSSLAWRVANDERLLLTLKSQGCGFGGVPHPASAWWNRKSLIREGRTGRQVFCDLVRQGLEAHAPHTF